MRKAISSTFFILAFVPVLILSSGCGKSPEPVVNRSELYMFAPLPAALDRADTGRASADMVALGRMLYFEPRLSKSGTISCNSCHDLAKYGVDGQRVSTGHMGQKGNRNSPTVFNAAGHFAQFWDGRADDVEAQAKGPVMNPVEMAMPDEATVATVLESMPEYVALFRKAFPGQQKPVNCDNMARAIGAFERGLTTPARWDAYLGGDQSALTGEEKLGLKTFLEAGCQSCHRGALVGGTLYQRLGAFLPYPDASDPGRYSVTKNEADRSVFKVPSLRNIEKTAPYFHHGRVTSLDQAVREMGEYQLGKTLSPEQTARIVTFLRTLTGKVDPDYVKPPVLPQAAGASPL